MINLGIDGIADLVRSGKLGLQQHEECAGAPWLGTCAATIQAICQQGTEFEETAGAMQPFADHFFRISAALPDEFVGSVVVAIKTAINSGYYISMKEKELRWTVTPLRPSKEADTLLSAISDAFEREIIRKWGDLHSARLRTVALMYGYLLGRIGEAQVIRTVSGEYKEKWMFISC